MSSLNEGMDFENLYFENMPLGLGAMGPLGSLGSLGDLFPSDGWEDQFAPSSPQRPLIPQNTHPSHVSPPGTESNQTFPRTDSLVSPILIPNIFHSSPISSAPHAPHVSPMSSAPHVSPMYSAPHVSPMSSAPHVSPMYSAPHVSPMYSAPPIPPVSPGPPFPRVNTATQLPPGQVILPVWPRKHHSESAMVLQLEAISCIFREGWVSECERLHASGTQVVEVVNKLADLERISKKKPEELKSILRDTLAPEQVAEVLSARKRNMRKSAKKERTLVQKKCRPFANGSRSHISLPPVPLSHPAHY